MPFVLGSVADEDQKQSISVLVGLEYGQPLHT